MKYTLHSPNGEIAISFDLMDNGMPCYTVTKNNDVIVQQSNLGLRTNVKDLTQGLELVDVTPVNEFNETYSVVSGKAAEYINHYNACDMVLKKGDIHFTIRFRAYDDGVAFSYLVECDGDTIEISSENTNFIVPSDWYCWHNTRYQENYEFLYSKDKFLKLPYNKCYDFILFPMLYQTQGGNYALINEANLNGNYSGIMLHAIHKNGGFTVLQASFVESQEDTVVSTLPFESPWRYIVIGDEKTIIENHLADNLADDPDRSIDWSFVKGGSTSWSWLDNERDTSEWGGYFQHDTDAIKRFIDLSAEMGWQYYIMDEGWQPASDAEDEHYIGYYDNFDEIKAYADEKGIGLFAWCYSSDLNTQEKRDARLKDWADRGIVGIKVDFFDAENQETLKLYETIYKECAKYGLIVNCHGANKSTGEIRTYPNVITREGIYGQEQGSVTADMYVPMAFTRFAVGSADFTEYLVPRLDNSKAGFQLGMTFVYQSGIHCFSDGAANYRTSEAANTMLKNFPLKWDETRYISGTPDDYIVIGRRSGNTWYIGGISSVNDVAKVSLDFLEDGNYTAIIYTDGTAYTDREKETKNVTNKDVLEIPVSENGGFAIKTIEV